MFIESDYRYFLFVYLLLHWFTNSFESVCYFWLKHFKYLLLRRLNQIESPFDLCLFLCIFTWIPQVTHPSILASSLFGLSGMVSAILLLTLSIVNWTIRCSTLESELKVTTARLLFSGTSYLIRFWVDFLTHFHTSARADEVSMMRTYLGNGSRTISNLGMRLRCSWFSPLSWLKSVLSKITILALRAPQRILCFEGDMSILSSLGHQDLTPGRKGMFPREQ